MPALTADRNTPRLHGDDRQGDAAAAVTIFAGSIVMRDAAGNLTPGATATGAIGAGRAEARVDNSSGTAGAETVPYRPGIFHYANSAGADEITKAEIGDVCFIVDDQTVAKTDGTSTRSPAGTIEGVDANGVWVRFDEALTAAAAV